MVPPVAKLSVGQAKTLTAAQTPQKPISSRLVLLCAPGYRGRLNSHLQVAIYVQEPVSRLALWLLGFSASTYAVHHEVHLFPEDLLCASPLLWALSTAVSQSASMEAVV